MNENFHPKPDFFRPAFRSLNGEWEFECGKAQPLDYFFSTARYAARCRLPYSCRSAASGVTEQARSVWYRRTFSLGEEASGTVLLHFSHLSDRSEIFVNAKLVGVTDGASFVAFDISDCVVRGDNTLVVSVTAASGTTAGIEGTVWLEWSGKDRILSLGATAVAAERRLIVEGYADPCPGSLLEVVLKSPSGKAERYRYRAEPHFTLSVPCPDLRPWSPDDPALYDLDITLRRPSGEASDRILTYAAYRTVTTTERGILLNGKPFPVAAVRDNLPYGEEGFVPTGTDALRQTFFYPMSLGFNVVVTTARKLSPAYLAFADRIGMAVIVEGAARGNPLLPKRWEELKNIAIGHPSVIVWNPVSDLYEAPDNICRVAAELKSFDPARPVLMPKGLCLQHAMQSILCNADTPSAALGAILAPDNTLPPKTKAALMRQYPLLLTTEAAPYCPVASVSVPDETPLAPRLLLRLASAIRALEAVGGAGYCVESLARSDAPGLIEKERLNISREDQLKLRRLNLAYRTSSRT